MFQFDQSNHAAYRAARAASANSLKATRDARETSTDLAFLQQQVDRLSMICEAMFELIKTHTDISDEELMGKMAELDLSDGVADGKITRGPVTCTNCNRANARRRELCLYCGEPLKTKPFD